MKPWFFIFFNLFFFTFSPAAQNAMPKQVVKTDSIPKDTGSLKEGKEIVKQGVAGSSYIVPEGKKWTVLKMYVNSGSSYNILVTSIKFSNPLLPGQKVQFPSWCAEGELLNSDQMTNMYMVRILEENIK